MTEPAVLRAYSKVELLDHFARALQYSGRSKETVRKYLSAMRRWLLVCDDLASPGKPSIDQWTRQRLRALSQNGFNTELKGIRAFYQWLYEVGHVAVDHRPRLPKSRRAPRRLPRFLNEQQIGAILAAPDLTTFVGFRDFVVMRLAYETGIKAGELVRLELGDVLEDGTLHVAGRRVPMSRELGEILDRWQVVRRKAKPGKSAVLFVTDAGKQFGSPRAVWDIVNRYARKAIGLVRGYERLTRESKRRPWQGYYPHLFRASFTAHLIHNGCDLRAVQVMLGLADIRELERFMSVDIELLKREHTKLRRPLLVVDR